jgi:Uma2 family endonuclease
MVREHGLEAAQAEEPMSVKPRVTAEELWRLGEGDVRRELVNGEVIEMPPAGGRHGGVAARISRRLLEHVDRHGGGKVVVGEVGFVLTLPYDPERVRAPDVAFVSTARLPEGRLPAGFIHGAPDLVVEVLSPSDNPADLQQKMRDWLEGGARLVWLIAPEAKTATVYHADGSARLLREHESLDGEDVLPGLRIPLAEVLG